MESRISIQRGYSMVRSFFCAAVLLCLGAGFAQADIVINEVMSSNASTIQDPRGDYSDWIEIYNSGSSPVNLGGYIISDSTHYWNFPSVTMPAGAYLILWANDQNKTTSFELNFKISAAGEVLQLGTAQALLQEVTVPMLATDESYGCYPDGNTSNFERMSNPSPGNVNQQNSIPNNEDAHYIRINEVALSNVAGLVDEDGETSDWIELYNDGSPDPVNLEGLRLADSSKQWIFPNISMSAGEFLVVFASDKNRTDPNSELHTNFKLSATGETLYFYNKDGSTEEDSVAIPAIAQDHSYCRIPDGSGGFEDSTLPTPGKANQYTTIEPNPDAWMIKINEVVAKNESGLRDFENDYEDWIELYNDGTASVDLQGLKLVDFCDGSGCNPQGANYPEGGRVWEFPDTLWLTPGDHLVVFASGKNELGAELHTNFDISADYGEQIAFANTNGNILSVFDVPFMDADNNGAADPDVSWGRDPDGSETYRIFDVPTPGEANTEVTIINNPDGQYVAINEVCSDNSSGLQDKDGEYSDWIELYNTHDQPINLEGLKLQNYALDGTSTTTWVFPGIEVAAHGFLVVFASDKNIIDPAQLHTNFKLSASGEGLRILNKDNSEETSVEVDPLSPNESFGRNPDGTGTFEVYTVPTPGVSNTQTTIQPNPDAWMITINEVVSDNISGLQDADGAYSDWIELYNKGTKTVDLVDLKLQDSGDVWSFPSVSMAPGTYLVVFASNKNRTGAELHTNFNVSSSGEILRILNKDSSEVEAFTVAALGVDQSHGRLPDGNANLQIFDAPTPGSANGIPGDLNYDLSVNYNDFMLLLNQWGRTDIPAGDINKDGTVGYSDFMLLLNNWTG